MVPINYKYNRYDPGIFMELYLPKKAEYQGILYDTLTGGFLIENVISHLKRHWDKITNLMGGSYTSRIKSKKQLEQISSVFSGYSMYEVDGVFFNPSNKQIVEEKTQVIRLMFRFDVDELMGALGRMSKQTKEIQHQIALTITGDFLACFTNKANFASSHEDEYSKKWPAHQDFIKTVISKLHHFELSMAMFILGYVVFEICEKIKLLHRTNRRQPEEEIWITSFWNLRINRITKI
jgi:hypothetical protein